MVGLIAVSDHSTIKVANNAGLRIAKLNAICNWSYGVLIVGLAANGVQVGVINHHITIVSAVHIKIIEVFWFQILILCCRYLNTIVFHVVQEGLREPLFVLAGTPEFVG